MNKLIFAVLSLTVFVGCTQKKSNESQELITHVLHADDVDQLSPDSVIAILKQGNLNFVTHHEHGYDAMSQLAEAAEDGQHPLAIVLSCIDSRVPVETIFDKSVGDLFVVRVAGNVVNPDVLGSMEYACEHSGAKVVLVLGHENCGAIHSACEGVKAGNMTQMLEKIKPAIECCDSTHCKNHHSAEFQNEVMEKNVEIMVGKIRKESEILSQLEQDKKIKIVGGVFNLHTGLVHFFN